MYARYNEHVDFQAKNIVEANVSTKQMSSTHDGGMQVQCSDMMTMNLELRMQGTAIILLEQAAMCMSINN